MRHLIVITLVLALVAVASAGYCNQRYSCGKTCGFWGCKTKYCNRRVCCSSWCGDDCETLCSRLCNVKYSCNRVCYREKCKGWWWGKSCWNESYSCKGTCEKKQCCAPWKGDRCDDRIIGPPPRSLEKK